jgi:hypothetical protein
VNPFPGKQLPDRLLELQQGPIGGVEVDQTELRRIKIE